MHAGLMTQRRQPAVGGPDRQSDLGGGADHGRAGGQSIEEGPVEEVHAVRRRASTRLRRRRRLAEASEILGHPPAVGGAQLHGDEEGRAVQPGEDGGPGLVRRGDDADARDLARGAVIVVGDGEAVDDPMPARRELTTTATQRRPCRDDLHPL